jgi:hypothetical protein
MRFAMLSIRPPTIKRVVMRIEERKSNANNNHTPIYPPATHKIVFYRKQKTKILWEAGGNPMTTKNTNVSRETIGEKQNV